MSKFQSPKRRSVRQNSGFYVAGTNKGSTCRIEQSHLIQPRANRIPVTALLKQLTVPALFFKNLGVIGAGVYVRSEASCTATGKLSWKENGNTHDLVLKLVQLGAGSWQRLGCIGEIIVSAKYATIDDLTFTFSLETQSPSSIYGVMIGALAYEYFTMHNHDVYTAFKTKTSLYIPDILYLDPVNESLKFIVEKGIYAGSGHSIVSKSCNRCSRFLPIDIENERNTISYSNHCVTQAPCNHNAFSRYFIESNTHGESASYVSHGYVVSHYGHQLECKVCKKFFVNLPLNPLRNSTQHREDSLRRRALEVLVTTLLGNSWIYHEHRINVGGEFDVHIWEKFERKCFKCECELKTPNTMELDHTLPLAYLWPLDNTAKCLCPSCNSSKSDKFPVDFYDNKQLAQLADKTGIPLTTLQSKSINTDAVQRLFELSVWFFDTFLSSPDYQKEREGKKAADLILHSLNNVLRISGYSEDLIALYRDHTGHLPSTVSLQS